MIRSFALCASARRCFAAFAAALWLWGALNGPGGMRAAAMSLTTDGDFTTVVICTAQGMLEVTLDGQGRVVDRAPVDDDGKHECPCVAACGGLVAALPTAVAAPVAPLRPSPDDGPGPTSFVAATPIRGPPLGPRAPPAFPG